jgi:hypothetical protein
MPPIEVAKARGIAPLPHLTLAPRIALIVRHDRTQPGTRPGRAAPRVKPVVLSPDLKPALPQLHPEQRGTRKRLSGRFLHLVFDDDSGHPIDLGLREHRGGIAALGRLHRRVAPSGLGMGRGARRRPRTEWAPTRGEQHERGREGEGSKPHAYRTRHRA